MNLIMNKNVRKGQSEIVGLIMIIIMISFAMIIYLKFSITGSNERSNIATEFKATDLSNSFVASITKTDIYCDNQQIALRDILAAIADGRSICSNQESLVDTFFKKTLDDTLKKMGLNYNFTVMTGYSNNPSSLSVLQDYSYNNGDFEEGCDITKPHSLSQNIITTRNSKNIFIRLLICN